MIRNEWKVFIRGWLPLLGLAAVAAAAMFGAFSLSGTDPFSFRYMNLTATLSAMGAARMAAIVGAPVAALFTLLRLSRDNRAHAAALLHSTADPRRLALSRVAVLALYACLLWLAALAATLGAWLAAGLSPDFAALGSAFGLVTLPALLLSLILCAGLYFLSASLDAAFLGFGTLFFVSLFAGDYKLSWVSGHAAWYSDFAGFDMHTAPLLYARMCCFLGFGGLFMGGLAAMRHHGLGFLASLGKSRSKRVMLPVAILLIAGSVAAYAAEPFVDVHSPLLKQASLSQWGNSENAPRQTAAGNLIIPAVSSDVTLTGSHLQGTARYTLEPAELERPLTFTLNGGLAVSAVTAEDSPAPYQLEKGRLTVSLPAGARKVAISYAGRVNPPALQSLAGYVGGESVYLQEGANWLPQPEGMALGTTLTGSITAADTLTFAVPGKLIAQEEQAGRRIWRYEMAAPLLDAALYGGEYEVIPLDVDGTAVELYISPRHRKAVEDSGLAGVVEEIVRFYSNTLGAYPFDVPLKVVETALYKSGGHSSLNLVTVAETAFNIQGGESADSFAWHNAVELLAHEIAHQWFGSGVPVAMEPPWSSEGLASFLSRAYIAHAFSPELAASMNEYSWLSAVEEQKNSYFADPATLAALSPAKREQISGEMLHAALYYEMPLLLLDMQKTLGEEVFYERLATVYQQYKNGEYLTYKDFLAAMELREEDVSLASFYTDSSL